MNQLAEWLSRIVTSWKFWTIVAPWEVGIRVRLGRRAIALVPGPHWRVPFVDEVLLVNTRTRVSSSPPVTISCDSGSHVRCVKAIIGFKIVDPLVAVNRFQYPSVAVMGRAQSMLATGQSAEEIEEALRIEMKPDGIEIEYFQLVEDVEVPALRLLQEGWTVSDDHIKNDGRKATHY